MYNYIKGKIAETTENSVIVEAGGVGYELYVSPTARDVFAAAEGEVKVYCRLCVREDEISLFGFSGAEEKAMFEKLIEVSGVGPKLALTVLGGMTAERLAAAIVQSDIAALSKIKGVGKKTAERIALELRDKVSRDAFASAGGASAPVKQAAPAGGVNEDAVLALMTLGYKRQEAAAAVERVQADGMTLEELVYNALKNA